ncbi:MAG TPA: hypothetical protein ENI61_04095 [Ignavibacteria bacterium]|nr:hypothetical protein [Ignavibacteria bacterium]
MKKKDKDEFDTGSKILLRLTTAEGLKLDNIIKEFVDDLQVKGLRIHFVSRAQMVRTIVLTYFDVHKTEKTREEKK